MSKIGRAGAEPRHVRLYHWMLDCPAYQSLDVYARALLIEFKKRYTGTNNGDIAFSGKEMEEALGCSNRPADRALRDLTDRGFVKLAKRGHFDWKARDNGGNRASTYVLTEYSIDYPQRSAMPATKDFMKWRAKEKTRGDVVTRMGGPRHRIQADMGGPRHPNGVSTSPDGGKIGGSNGVSTSPPYSIPHTQGDGPAQQAANPYRAAKGE
ncbi:Bro-N domain-containing protein [Mesorhizobium sp. M0138]|uniref:BRO-N domain-containing protein n=1 Tax=Mesorhizobium sp. M0138 TaxID=2956891 RepID=UPI003336B5F5